MPGINSSNSSGDIGVFSIFSKYGENIEQTQQNTLYLHQIAFFFMYMLEKYQLKKITKLVLPKQSVMSGNIKLILRNKSNYLIIKLGW